MRDHFSKLTFPRRHTCGVIDKEMGNPKYVVGMAHDHFTAQTTSEWGEADVH